MTQIDIRNLDEDVYKQLRLRAERNGRSIEEEVREILRAAVVRDAPSQMGLGTQISRRFADCHLDQEFEIPEWRGFEAGCVRFER